MIRCIDVVELQDKIMSEEQQIAQHKDELDRLALEMEKDRAILKDIDEELIQVKADLQASDLGAKKNQLEAQNQLAKMLTEKSMQWRKMLEGLRKWEEDEATYSCLLQRQHHRTAV